MSETEKGVSEAPIADFLSRDRRGLASRVRWALMPWWAFAWRYRAENADAPNPGRWWHACIGSVALWLDNRVLWRLPGGALFDPIPERVCGCAECIAYAEVNRG